MSSHLAQQSCPKTNFFGNEFLTISWSNLARTPQGLRVFLCAGLFEIDRL
jgi:hypothetical protein